MKLLPRMYLFDAVIEQGLVASDGSHVRASQNVGGSKQITYGDPKVRMPAFDPGPNFTVGTLYCYAIPSMEVSCKAYTMGSIVL
ncbi:hypothetical protein NC653_004796 [Populus alba x Populus x berolinensis]|uniref:Uncharacterized protein n=1 Tax=Populus alba x Populus x berolinensis TaxID=444605 RepID=A0AAD6RVG7_9ROSI|nr:hypothetical protein NC653_004796 [Populus alba x Populus x berolinensis]